MFNSEDDALEPGYFNPWYFDCFFNYSEYQPIYYPCFEQDFALGQSGIQSTISDTDLTQNYLDIVVEQEINDYRDADADGRCDLLYGTFWFHLPFVCTITLVGDNHLGYIGFRESNGSLRDNGAMNIVVDTLQNRP